jgi:hypothetical protein
VQKVAWPFRMVVVDSARDGTVRRDGKPTYGRPSASPRPLRELAPHSPGHRRERELHHSSGTPVSVDKPVHRAFVDGDRIDVVLPGGK